MSAKKAKSAPNDNGPPSWQEYRFAQSYPNAGDPEPAPDPEAEEEPSQ